MKPGDLGKIKGSNTFFFVVGRIMRSTSWGEDTPHLIAIVNGKIEELPEFWLRNHGEIISENG